MGDRTRGLYGKFFVERTDGKSELGEKHHGCEYYVLDLDHDKYAVPALARLREALRSRVSAARRRPVQEGRRDCHEAAAEGDRPMNAADRTNHG